MIYSLICKALKRNRGANEKNPHQFKKPSSMTEGGQCSTSISPISMHVCYSLWFRWCVTSVCYITPLFRSSNTNKLSTQYLVYMRTIVKYVFAIHMWHPPPPPPHTHTQMIINKKIYKINTNVICLTHPDLKNGCTGNVCAIVDEITD